MNHLWIALLQVQKFHRLPFSWLHKEMTTLLDYFIVKLMEKFTKSPESISDSRSEDGS